MASGPISLSNISAIIDSFKNDFQDCSTKFDAIDDSFIKLKCNHQRRKSEMINVLSDIHDDLLLNLKGIDEFDMEENVQMERYEDNLNELNNVLESYKKKFCEISDEAKYLKEKFFNVYIDCQAIKENELPTAHGQRIPDKVNPFILNSRQTQEPFIVMMMKKGARNQCNGCRQNIPFQSLYLSHVEEYPAGSKIYRPHGYHINLSCLFDRGFEDSYLRRSEVSINRSINKDIIDILREIGFVIKNLQSENAFGMVPNFSDNDSSESDDNDFPDDRSDTSNVPSVDLSHLPVVTFTYHRKPPAQKKKLICKGCQAAIETETYIAQENNKIQSVFHIKRSCLQSAGMFPEDRSQIRVMVYRFLKTHNELKELISCGFYFSKIIGVRPQNPNVKKPHINAPSHPMKPMERPRPVMDFIFNEEAFVYQRLPHGEKCRGCQNGIRRDDMSLRHKERVPRENMDIPPLLSQYYHASKECLFSRGFTEKYLSIIKCNAILSGEDNLSRVTDLLISCGFYNENIVYSPKDSQEVKGFEVHSLPITPENTKTKKADKEFILYVDNCANPSTHCEGCGFILTPMKPCFIYAQSPVQDSNAKIFHIRNSCLKYYFTKEQIMATTCVLNNMLEVKPSDIIDCGLVKIVTKGNYTPPPSKPANVHKPRPRNYQPNKRNNNSRVRQRSSFVVDIVVDDRHVCCTCKKDLVMDKYILIIKNRDPDKSMLHMDPNCVEKVGIPRDELAKCPITSSVYVSQDGEKKLHDCGFRNFCRLNPSDD